MAESKSEDLWNPYRDLHQIVNKYLTIEGIPVEAYSELENILKINKQAFFSLLHNLPKNSKSREELKKGTEDGLSVRGIGHQILSKELYQETIIVSDMFDLNEYIALDLLCTAQIQMPFYPNLPRGLVAILLYYDGRKFLVSTLRMLIQARSGISWCIKLPKQTQRFIDNFTDQLAENGLLNRILDLLKTLDVTQEIQLLQKNLALGGPRHRKQVMDTFNSIKVMLADCIFQWSKQSGLNKVSTLSLIRYLKDVNLESEASGKLDNVTMYLIMSLLNAFDLSILHSREDGEEVVQKLPILSEDDYIITMINELLPTNNKWTCEGLQAVAVFGFAVCLSSLRLVTQNLQLQNAIDYEDQFIDAAIVMKVFEFVSHIVMENEHFYSEELIYRRMHHLFCDFIVQMYPKVKELRIKADETARTIQAYVHESLEIPPNLPRYFENLLLAISKLYDKDTAGLQLMLDFWYPLDASQHGAHHRAHPRSISLFKFIKLAGDMIPPSLFVNYLKMLASLSGCQQAARNCFNLLKQSSGFNTNVTWDHFFNSFNQYFGNLKQELPSGSENIYRHSRVYHKGITPQEIEGLDAVLSLIRKVADNDEFSRLAFCEHPGWAPLTTLLGLVSCSIPIPLKANLLHTLASLCKLSETAAQMWNNLEVAQILVTIPTASSYQPRGIQTELDEVESRLEEYPLTYAWLSLLDVLTDYGIPRTLGAGARQPGFDPYLTFLINTVFLKFNSRTYKNPSEKWQIASICLKLFSKFLNQYEPDAKDFPSHNKINDINSPPGFHLMLQLHTKSELFNGLLFVVNEGNTLYDSFIPFPGEKHISECILHTFNIITKCLELQTKFFHLLPNSNCPNVLIHMNKLLLTINPRTGRPDHVLNIMKYLCYQDRVPKQCLQAVKILTLLTTSLPTHTNIMNILLSSNDVDKRIREGFVECLDATFDEDMHEVIVATKKALFNLFQQCLPYNAPNLTHFLFGFDIHKNVSKTIFQLPGVLNFPRTCMHSLITMLRLAVIQKNSDPSLIENAYFMLYSLCSNSRTSEPVLRFIRMQPNFYKDGFNFSYNNYKQGVSELNQLSWILKIAAIELRITCATRQVLNIKTLTSLLVGYPHEAKFNSDTGFSLIQKSSDPIFEDSLLSIDNLSQDNFLIKLIFDFKLPKVDEPIWSYFDSQTLQTYLEKCEIEGTKIIDIKKLHQNLLEEITNTNRSSALGQRQTLLEEIEKVLLFAVSLNKCRRSIVSMVRFADAWRQVTQILVTFLPPEIISPKEQILLIIFLLENILQKVVKVELLPEISGYLSGTILLLLENLHKNHLKEEKYTKTTGGENKAKVKSVIETNMLTLKSILNNIIKWLVDSDTQSQKLRINLYGSLVIFLQLLNVTEDNSDTKVKDSMYISRLDSSKYRIQEDNSLFISPSALSSSFNEKLIEVICYDCTSSQDVCKMLAMSCFSLLISLSGNINWITYLSGRGYMRHVIESILKSDNDLRALLEPIPENLKNIYLYDSKMSFLSRIATVRIGAELLLEQRILSVLSTMKTFDFHPELTKHLQAEEPDNYIMSVEVRYLKIWEPTLHLCNAILTSLGTDNEMAVKQIINFILSHLDVVELVLRSGGPHLSVESLKELSLLTSVIARTANNDLLSILDVSETPQEGRTYMFRIQKLMLALVPRFILSESTLRQLLCDPNNEQAAYQTSERLSCAIEIVSNLLLYCGNSIKNNGIEHDSVGVLFQPNLSDTLVLYNGNQKYKSQVDPVPSLGIIVQNLINMVNYYHKEKVTFNFLNRKIGEIPELGTTDLKDFAQTQNDVIAMREQAMSFVMEKFKMKKHNIDYSLLIIEHALYIIWAHLDYYMLKAIPRSKNFGLQISNQTMKLDTTLATSTEAMWKVSTDDISTLKQGLVSIFNDSFSRQLIETAQGRPEQDVGFLEVLLRKIKRLIQFVPVK